jgi:hypothetical protein
VRLGSYITSQHAEAAGQQKGWHVGFHPPIETETEPAFRR